MPCPLPALTRLWVDLRREVAGRRARREVVVAVGDERGQRVHVMGVLHHRDLVRLWGSEGEHVGRRNNDHVCPVPPQIPAMGIISALRGAGAGFSPRKPLTPLSPPRDSAALTKCAGEGERLSFSVAPAGTSSSGHFICRY